MDINITPVSEESTHKFGHKKWKRLVSKFKKSGSADNPYALANAIKYGSAKESKESPLSFLQEVYGGPVSPSYPDKEYSEYCAAKDVAHAYLRAADAAAENGNLDDAAQLFEAGVQHLQETFAKRYEIPIEDLEG